MGRLHFLPPLGTLLPLLSPDRLIALLDLLERVRKIWPQRQGLYEVLDYDATLELVDPQGACAIFRRRQQVRFLQDHVIAFEDYAWGEGDLFADYVVSPGVVVDRYREGDRWNLLISLRQTKGRGDVETFHIVRTVRDGFTRPEEWRQVEIRHFVHRLRLAVVFPAARPCRRALLRSRHRNRTLTLGQDHLQELPHGRQMLVWETQNVHPYEVFTLEWHW